MCSHFASLLEVLLINWWFFQLSVCASDWLQLRTGWAGRTSLLLMLPAGWDGDRMQPTAHRRVLLKSLCLWHVKLFRFGPSSRCQNIWFSFREIFVVIFPSGFNYCHWDINGCPAGLIDFICVPSYLRSVTDKSALFSALTFIKRPQPEELRIDGIQRMNRYLIGEIQKRLLLLL